MTLFKKKIDIDEFINNLDKVGRVKVLTYAVKKLFNTIDQDDILKENEFGQWQIEGKPINDTTKSLLIAEAKGLLKSKLWEVLQNDIKYQANKKMFLLAQNEEQLTAGKMFLYALDCINTRLKSMEKEIGNFNSNGKLPMVK